METLYRKVAVSERMPDKSGFYFTYSSSGVKKTIWFMNDKFSYVSPSYNPEFWIEEIPDPTDQLKADKEELLEMLMQLYDLKHIKDLDGKTPYYLEQQPLAWTKAKSLLQKHKQ